MELPLLIITFIGAWFWLDSLHARDIAVDAGRAAAEKYGLQLLDETVAFAKLWIARDQNGRMRFRRTYHFEVSDTGTNRLACRIILLGKRIEALYIPPHRD